MMGKLFRILAAALFAIAFHATASAQFSATINGPFLNGTPPTPYGTQLFQYNCTNAIPTSGNCAPVVQVSNAAPLGPQIPSASVGVVLTPTQVTTDPCSLGGGVGGSVSKLPFNFTGTATTIQIMTPQPSPPMQGYLCNIDINTVAANTITLTAGLGATCATGTPTTLAGPMSWPALYQWARGTGGATVFRTLTSGHGLCVTQTGAGVITISGTIVQQ